MATAATDDESGEIRAGELQLYHYQDGTPWLLGSGTFGKVRYIIFKFVDLKLKRPELQLCRRYSCTTARTACPGCWAAAPSAECSAPHLGSACHVCCGQTCRLELLWGSQARCAVMPKPLCWLETLGADTDHWLPAAGVPRQAQGQGNGGQDLPAISAHRVRGAPL